MPDTLSNVRDVVFIGGGHAHALVLRDWGMKPVSGVRLTVINPGPTAPYTGMLPGHVAGHYDRDTLEIDLQRLAQFAGARLILSHANQIDTHAKLIHLKDGPPVPYDLASIDVGITAQMQIDGFSQNAVGAKPLDLFANRWREFKDLVSEGAQPATVAVIGGGIAGCELAMAMAHGLHSIGAAPVVTVIEAGDQISGIGPMARMKLLRAMNDLGVEVRTNANIVRVENGQVVLDAQNPVPAALCVGAAGAFPHNWVAQTDLPLHEGFIVVDPDLRVKGHSDLFALGDCAHMPFAPRPKAGVFAVRAAPVLHHNLRARLTDAPLKPFRPQKSYLKLISLGGKSALAEKYGFAPSGPALWRWKDKIDRAFMDQFTALGPKG
ncbi:MAG: FAD-dependent oxidoreductase [Sulfitobacter sp.]